MASYKDQYENRKPLFLSDEKICKANREHFKRFLEFEEHKLKRTNGLRELDEGCYKTLYSYVSRFSTLNLWFGNKDLAGITKEDIQKVYDGLEDGKILNALGKPFADRKTYYNKIFKGKFFEMLGKDKIAREVMEYYKPNGDGEVRFIIYEDFLKVQETAIQIKHKLLTWLCFDYGENVSAFLQTKKKDYVRSINPDTHEPEYRVNLRREILKRSRTARSEISNFPETARYLDMVLSTLKDDDYVFPFDYRAAKKFLDRAVKITKIKCQPRGQTPTWKDLRSGAVCHLLKLGWHTDELNARLGHKPSSREIDKYISFLAIDRHKPKRKVYDNQMQIIQQELEEMRAREKLQQARYERLENERALDSQRIEMINALYLKLFDKTSKGDGFTVDGETFKEANKILMEIHKVRTKRE